MTHYLGPKTDDEDLATQIDVSAIGAVRAYRSSALNLVSSANTLIPFNAEQFDVSGWFDITTNVGRYTPQAAGIYEITAWVGCATLAAAANYLQVNLFKNGGNHTELALIQDAGHPNFPRTGGSTLVEMNGSTDYVDIRAFQNSGSNKALNTGAGASYFCAHYLGTS